MPISMFILCLLILALGVNSYINYRLREGNKALVAQLVDILRESTSAKQKIKEINRDKENAQRALQTLQVRIQQLEDEKKQVNSQQEMRKKKRPHLKNRQRQILPMQLKGFGSSMP